LSIFGQIFYQIERKLPKEKLSREFIIAYHDKDQFAPKERRLAVGDYVMRFHREKQPASLLNLLFFLTV